MPVLVKLTNVRIGTLEKTTDFIDANGELTYLLEPGNWRLELEIFEPERDGASYYGQRLIYTSKQEAFLNRSFYLIPVGILEGVVVHEDGRLAGKAVLAVHCSYGSQFDYPSKTDAFGAFKIPQVPAGMCRFTATAGNRVGTAEVANLSRGELQSIKIVLDQSTMSLRWSTAFAWLIATGLVLVVLLSGYALLRKRIKRELVHEFKTQNGSSRQFGRRFLRRIKHPSPAMKQEKSSEMNPRARDILETLNEREKKTVQFLLEQKNHQATQGAIRNATGIPKTSLVRVFDSLGGKKVVSLEKIGKMKKLTLTPWFMGKD